MKKITAVILPRDYTGDWKQYEDNRECPLANALKRQFPHKNIITGGSFVHVGHAKYHIPMYWNRVTFNAEHRNPRPRLPIILTPIL